MKRTILGVILVSLIISGLGCVKGTNVEPCTNKTPQSEQADMQAYAAAQGFSMTLHPNGMYYQVVNPGSGAKALATSKIFVKYTGRLISSNAIFDQQNNSEMTGWVLSSLIPGWQAGLPLIAIGGTLRLIVPSSLAYGCRPYSTLPGNAVLFFEIELVRIE
ncbi:MAG TPA: FKBP-type peptidyl-prolyl cis-trans isomerase [Chitinophagaceae bacterium]